MICGSGGGDGEQGGGPGVWEKREYGEGDGEMKGRVGGKGEEGNGVRERSGGEMEGD